jgi:hypothetical protein
LATARRGGVDRASGAWARVVGDQVVEGRPSCIWEAIEGVYAGWHAAGEPDPPEIGLGVDRKGRQRSWLRRPEGWGWSAGLTCRLIARPPATSHPRMRASAAGLLGD